MPKLTNDQAKKANEAESTGGVMEDGIYIMRLVKVEANSAKNYWKWTFKVPEDTTQEEAKRYKNWNQWVYTSLSDDAAWKMRETFEAFGKATDTDTDELLGGLVRAQVKRGTIQDGDRAGEPTAKIVKLMPLDPAAAASASNGGKVKQDKPLF